jgi:DNA polymerase-3 subunit gamma/tau
MQLVAYLSLYRKYRPQNFAEILGQEHVSRTLANAITEDRVAHAYLFTGPRGTGKTSTARILAKALNCEQGPTPHPCGVCASCVAIAAGSSIDFIELDAASHSGVDDTRDILAGVALASAGARKKVYVIDEVHMLTTPSFNALLKTLEEPPEHVIFILATTEAHKVLHTVQSRTQRFDFRPISVEVLEQLLVHVAKAEALEADESALQAIARHAEGGARDALSILDQLSSFGGPITSVDVERLLGGRTEEAYVEMFDRVASGDLAGVFWSVHSLVSQGADVGQLARGALRHARNLLLLKTAPDADELIEIAEEDRSRLIAQTERFTPGALLRIVDLVAKSLTEMREAPNHRLLFEVALTRATAPDTDPSSQGLLGRIERIERRLGIEGAPTESIPAPQPSAAPPIVEPAPSSTSEPPAPTDIETAVTPAAEAPAAEPAPVAAAEVGLGHIKDAWPATLRELGKRSKRVEAFLKPSRPLSFDGSTLAIEVQSEFHTGQMAMEQNRSMLVDALHASLGIRPALQFAAQGQEPAEPESTTDDSGDYSAEAAAPSQEHDPVELVKKGLGAEVVEER